MLSVTSRIAVINCSICASIAFRFSASRSSSSPLPESGTARKVPRHDVPAGAVYRLDPAERIAAHQDPAEQAESYGDRARPCEGPAQQCAEVLSLDRKSTRMN